METLAELLHNMWQIGYTVRKFPGGEREMYHRWHWTKIKGSRPIIERCAQNITVNNALYARLVKTARGDGKEEKPSVKIT